ncbi:MAG: hypothetical protein N2508_05085 [Anaerolineae bacterium]|nr:hypothetical protein [Anaerolineae bacterium]
MRKVKLLLTVILVMLFIGGATIPVLSWFDRTYEGYLPGAPSNGRLGYTHGADVRAWTLDMRWNTVYYVRRDNNPRIDITADCTGAGGDKLHVSSWFSNLPATSFQSWNDCGNLAIREEGEIFFDKYGISTSVTNYEADVIFQKKLASANGEVNHTYQRSSGPDPKVCGTGTCGDPNHDWLAKTVYVNYNYDHFEPANAGWVRLLGASAYASGLPALEEQDVHVISLPGVPFTIQMARDGEHTRAYVEVDFSDPVALQSYTQWNAVQARTLSANLRGSVYVKVTFRVPISIAEAQNLVDAVGLDLEQVTIVGRDKEGQPYSGGTLSDGVDSAISLGTLESVLEERGVKLDGVMVIEGSVNRGNALQMLSEMPQVYMLDVTTDFAFQKAQMAGTECQGVVVPSPYWMLYLQWLRGS